MAARVSQFSTLIIDVGTPKARASQVLVLVVDQGTPAARFSQVGLAVVEVGTPAARFSQVGLAVVEVGTPAARFSQTGLLTVVVGTPKARFSQTGLLVVHPKPLALNNYANQTLTFSETLYPIVTRSVSQSLTLTQSVTISNIRQISQTLSLTQTADYEYIAGTTLAIFSQVGLIVITRSPSLNNFISQTLSFTEILNDVLVVRQTLSFIENISLDNIKIIDQTLSFSEILTHQYLVTFNQTLSFTDHVRLTFPKSIDDTLSFTESLSRSQLTHLSQTLTLTENIVLLATRRFFDNLIFNQIVDVETWLNSTVEIFGICTRDYHITDELIFRDCASYDLTHQSRRIYKGFNQLLTFISIAHSSFGEIFTKSLSQTLTFNESINKKYLFTDNLAITQSVIYVHGVLSEISKTDTLTLTQTLSYDKIFTISKSLTQSFILSDSNSVERVRIIEQQVFDNLVFSDFFSARALYNRTIGQSIDFKKDFEKGFGEGQTVRLPIVNIIRTQKLITILGNGQIITLPPAEWGDSKKVRNSINLRRSMNGLTYTYVKRNERFLLKYNFKLGRRKSLELRNFLRNNISSVLILTNYYDAEIWIVKLAQNPFELTFESSSKTEFGRISIELQFEGIKT